MSLVERFRQRPQFWLLCTLLVLVFLFGGASRSDVLPLVLLRPASVFMLFAAALTVEREHLVRHRALLTLFAACVILVALHLVPLPPVLWHALPGRELLVSIDQAAGFDHLWRPLTLAPSDGWNAFYSLAVPGAVLLLAIQLRDREYFAAFALVVMLGMASAFVSLFQVTGAPEGPLYFYRITNNGSAVGFFSNRNHQALMIAALFPILAGLAAVSPAFVANSAPRWSALAMAFVLPPLLLVTGSRSGLGVGVLGMAFALAIAVFASLPARVRRTGRKPVPKGLKAGLIAAAAIALMAVTAFLSRAEAIRRVLASDATDDLRFKVWHPIFRASLEYLPFGSGVGSFVPVYKIVEPDTLLFSGYLNHAHNDWLELWLTMGVPGLILVIAGLVWFVRRLIGIVLAARKTEERRPNLTLAAAAAAVIALLLAGSVVDYPLRTPALAALMVLCAVVCDRYKIALLARGVARNSSRPRGEALA
jgi:O-antigen ligase